MIRILIVVLALTSAVGNSTLSAAAAKPDATTVAIDRAMRDLRSLVTALEAYSTDYDGIYAQPNARRDGTAADLDGELAPIYLRTVPHLDPWEHAYRFVISDSRRLYAFYSLGPSGVLDPAVEMFLNRLRQDGVGEAELTTQRSSENLVFASGMLVFALPQVLQALSKAKAEEPRFILQRESDTAVHRSERDVEVLATAIEAYIQRHDALPKEVRGKRVHASALVSILTPLPGYDLAVTDPWSRPYEIATSPSGRRTAVYTRGEENSITAENEALIQQTLRGELTSTATTYAVGLIVTSLVAKEAK